MQRWILVGIIFFAFALRVIGLADHPSGFHADEASFGYDAYSILKTGKDQWGYTLPLVLKSFGDDKLPVFTYLDIPVVAIFGLNEFAVRLPGVIIGTIAVFVIYLLVGKLFNNKKLALFASFMLAVNPWHIMLSRGAFESNLTNLFLPLGVYLFLRSFNQKKYLYLAFVIFLVNIFTYHTARILTPLIVLFLITIFKEKLKISKTFNLSILIAIIFFAVSIMGILLGGSRLSTSSLVDINFTDDRYNAYLTGENIFISKIFYNKTVYIIRQFITNYLSYFSPQFLFLNGVGEATYGMFPGIGVFYLIEIVFLIGFLIKFIKEKISREFMLVIFWLLVSFIPAALTKGPGYAGNRSAIAIIPIIIIFAIGANYFYGSVKKKIFVIFYVLILVFNFLYVSERYWVGQTANNSKDMTYGMKQVFMYLQDYSDKNIVVSRAITEPQIFTAFYNRINPIDYQIATNNWKVVNGWVDQQGSYSLLNYTFRDVNYDNDKKLENTVLVSVPKDFPADIKPNIVINYPNQEPAYYIIVNNDENL